MSGLTHFLMDELELSLVPVVADLEDNGYLIDAEYFRRLRERLGPERQAAMERVRAAAGQGFNPASDRQVRELLYDRLRLPVTRTTDSGLPSTDGVVLELAARDLEVAGNVLEYRKLTKVLGTYATLPDKVGADGRLRVPFNQLAAATGRFSSPSVIQTLPKDDAFALRKGFVAPDGYRIVAADFDQQELRVLAQCSGDRAMREALAAGVDLHGLAAVKVFGLECEPNEVESRYPEHRKRAKAIQFGLVYGKSAYGLAESLEIERGEAEQLIADYFRQFPGVKLFIDDAHRRLLRDGHLDDLFGRRRYFPDAQRKRPRHKPWHQLTEAERRRVRAVAKAKREGQNFLIQGPSATITKLAMITCHEHVTAGHPDIRMVLTLHDELQFEVPDAEVDHFAAELPCLMCDLGLERFGFEVPMKVEVKAGPTWGDLDPWEGSDDVPS